MLARMWVRPVNLKFSKSGRCGVYLFKKQEDFSLNRDILKSRKKCIPDYYSTISLSLLVKRSSSKYSWFIWCLCQHIHSPLLSKNMLFGGSLRIMRILYLAEVDVEHLQTCMFRLTLALRELISPAGFHTFLTTEKYYKNPVSLIKFGGGERSLKLQPVSTPNLPIVQVVAPLSSLKNSKW